jgi:hypothetical protein
MRASSIVIVGLFMLLVGIFLSYILVPEDHRIFAQFGIPADSILLNNTNTTPNGSYYNWNYYCYTPHLKSMKSLIGKSTLTTSNTTLLTDNKTGEAKPLGGIKY